MTTVQFTLTDQVKALTERLQFLKVELGYLKNKLVEAETPDATTSLVVATDKLTDVQALLWDVERTVNNPTVVSGAV